MPALEAFGRKWRIGSDDLVFPNLLSLCIRIIWFCLFGYILNTYDRDYRCEDEKLLRLYLCILTGVHIAMCLIEVVTISISARGTMADPSPRKNISKVLYVEAGIFTVKFAWDVVGVLWAFDPSIDCPDSHPILILARCVLLWNLFASVAMALYAILRIAVCRLPCVGPRLSDTDRHRRLGRDLSHASSHGLLALSSEELRKHRQRDSAWKWRMQLLCCCMRLAENQRNVFAEIGTVMADSFTFFRGYVPSDVAAGIALMAMEQSTECSADDPLHKDLRTPLDFRNSSVCAHFNRVVYYAKYAMAVYGWRTDTYRNGLRGMATSLGRLCGVGKSKRETVFKANGDPLGWSVISLRHLARVTDEDILYASFVSEVFCPAFCVVVDHCQQTVVVTIRGSLSIKDALTDLSAQPSLLTMSEKGDFYGHKGMIASAHALQVKLESEKVLERAFQEHQGYGLVLVGHSLGAGVASLLAILLRRRYQNLHCYAYSPPGGLLCMTAVPRTRSYITTVVVENDFIPRLSMQNLHSFSERVLHNIQSSAVPKYRIFLTSGLQWLGLCGAVVRRMGNRRVSVSTLAILKEPLLSTHFDDDSFEEDIYEDVEDIYDEVAAVKAGKRSDRVTGKEAMQVRERMPLFLPGKIIHITRDSPRGGCCGVCRRRPVMAHWTAQSEFSELVMEKNMLRDHTIDHIYSTLLKLQRQEKLLRRQ